ncbi:MAG: hypothetical protein JSV33_01755 [bacterium]|nr:MAG: hypothetical protein JSV33_01755 [bacterium]
MRRLKCALVQGLAVVVIGGVVAFAHNAFSVNGINPFRGVHEVPVIDEPVTEAVEVAGAEVVDGIRFVTLDAFRALMNAGKVVIDSRTAEEYEEGHIPGAILLDYYDMGRYLDEVIPRLPAQEEILIYCAGPDCEDSELLARELYMMGFRKLLVFEGGWEEWEDSGLAVERGMM